MKFKKPENRPVIIVLPNDDVIEIQPECLIRMEKRTLPEELPMPYMEDDYTFDIQIPQSSEFTFEATQYAVYKKRGIKGYLKKRDKVKKLRRNMK